MVTLKSLILSRPRGIVTLASALVVGGVLFLLGAGALLLADQLELYRGALAIEGLGNNSQNSAGFFALVGGALQLTLAVGLFRLRRWAWGVSVLFTSMNVGIGAMMIQSGVLLSPERLVTVITATLILLYLLAPGVVRAFFHRTPSASAKGSKSAVYYEEAEWTERELQRMSRFVHRPERSLARRSPGRSADPQVPQGHQSRSHYSSTIPRV